MKERIAGFIATLGEATTKLAYQSICDLDIPCVLVSGVRPGYRAVNVGMKALKEYDYVLKSDADIILKKDALTKMLKLMSGKVGAVAGRVVYDENSFLKGHAGFVMLFNMKAWREVGEYLNEPGCDRNWVRRMEGEGWRIYYCDDVCGVDIRLYRVMEIVKKFHALAIKDRIASEEKQSYVKYCLQRLVHMTKYVGLSRNFGSILAFLGTLLALSRLPLFNQKERGITTKTI